MSQIFWVKDRDTGEYRPDGLAQSKSVVVTLGNPLPVQLIHPEDNDYPPFEIKNTYLPPVAGKTITRWVKASGVTTGSAYSDGDAMGTKFIFADVFRPEQCSGTIVGAFIIDKDDEGNQVDVPLFIDDFTATTDDSAFAPSDDDLMKCRAVLQITGFSNWGSNQFGRYEGTPQWISANSPNLWCQLVARAAINLAAGSEPWVGIVVVPD